MAKGGGGGGTQGWGEYLQDSLNITVVNSAIKSRSARSFTTQKHFDAMAARLVPGDFVVMEFGHNDAGHLHPTDNGKTDCPGAGNETCHGRNQTVLTFSTYLIDAVNHFKSKNATVILSSMTPLNPWATGHFSYTPTIYTNYTRSVAAATGSTFIDHGQYTANLFKADGPNLTDSYFPHQTIHTNTAGAKVVAEAFVRGLKCGPSGGLESLLNRTTSSFGFECV
ncbi:hypothetical protein RQP46_010038 [Phenoliferia psychrophenolica]